MVLRAEEAFPPCWETLGKETKTSGQDSRASNGLRLTEGVYLPKHVDRTGL